MRTLALVQDWAPWHSNHMGWWGGWMMLWWLLIVLLVFVGVIWLLRGRPGTPPGGRAEDVLRERYARGEIDDETYRRMLAELRRR